MLRLSLIAALTAAQRDAMPIARVALPVATATTFDYWVPEGLAVARGSIVRVTLGTRRLDRRRRGRCAATPAIAREKLQPIDRRRRWTSRCRSMCIDLATFVASYYHEPIGLALALAVPPLAAAQRTPRAIASDLRLTDNGVAALPGKLARAPAARALFDRFQQGGGTLAATAIATLPPHWKRTLRRWRNDAYIVAADAAAPVAAGRCALCVERRAIRGGRGDRGRRTQFVPFLLHGVTGSGKTDVYLAAAARVLAQGRAGADAGARDQPDAATRRPRACGIARPARRDVAQRACRAASAAPSGWPPRRARRRLVLGTRLAVFAPLPALGLVVVDEEQDASYKQQDNVRYHARDAAIWRAQRRAVPVVLGSATPSLEIVAARARAALSAPRPSAARRSARACCRRSSLTRQSRGALARRNRGDAALGHRRATRAARAIA